MHPFTWHFCSGGCKVQLAREPDFRLSAAIPVTFMCVLTSAPACTSSLTTSICPHWHATNNGLPPSCNTQHAFSKNRIAVMNQCASIYDVIPYHASWVDRCVVGQKDADDVEEAALGSEEQSCRARLQTKHNCCLLCSYKVNHVMIKDNIYFMFNTRFLAINFHSISIISKYIL